jgi:dihydrofolate reductase
MRRIRYAVAMSLDAYIAGPNGESDWIIMDPEIDFGALMRGFDTVLMGRRTFQAAAAHGGGGAMPGMKTVVVSTTMRPEDHPKVTVVADRVEETLARLRAEPGKDIWLFGGGSLFRSLLDAGLVDSVEVAVVPVLLGSGVPLLPPPARRVGLRLVGSKVYKTGIVSLEYAVDPGGPPKGRGRKPKASRPS